MAKVSIHRFQDSVAIAVGEGQTYLTYTEATKLAEHIQKILSEMDKVSFRWSKIESLDMEVNGKPQTFGLND